MSVRSSRRSPLINGAVVDAHVVIFDGTTGAIKDGGVPAGTGTVTNSGTLTANQLIVGAGTTVVAALGTLGTTTTLLHGNAGGAPTFAQASLTADVTGTLPIANGGTNSATALSGSSIMVSNGSAVVQGTAGTTTTVLHGNAAGAPTYGQVSLTADVSGDLPFANFVQSSAASKLVGRGSASGAGDFEEITLGTGLSMSATTLSATGTSLAQSVVAARVIHGI